MLITIHGHSVNGIDQISFPCPKCGPPYIVIIYAKLNSPPDQTKGYWGYTIKDDKVSIIPSIQCSSHGIRKVCGLHCTITNDIIEIN